jgi:hypothetical protein
MKTYLLFFGKSQDFTTYAFDNKNYIKDFNTVIKDFDLLESKIFTVDSIENKEMLAKYNFTAKDGRKYSLLKLYSFAQAFSGDRVAGSIYGVALLSQGDISITKSNLNILNLTKSNFAKLSLNGLKFNSSDFYEEVNKIWNAVVNHKEGNYLDKIAFTNRSVSNTNLGNKGFYVNNLFDNSPELDSQINFASRIYISEDLAHLKRVHSQRGNEFKIYAKTKNGYEIYQEPKPIEPPKPIDVVSSNLSTPISEEQKLKHKISDLEEENDELYREATYYKKKSKTTFLQLGSLATILLLTTITFFFTSNFWSDKKDAPEAEPFEKDVKGTITTGGNSIDIDPILANTDSLDIFASFIKNVKNFKNFKPNSNISEKEIKNFNGVYDSVLNKAKRLGINVLALKKDFEDKKTDINTILLKRSKDENLKKLETQNNQENKKESKKDTQKTSSENKKSNAGN